VTLLSYGVIAVPFFLMLLMGLLVPLSLLWSFNSLAGGLFLALLSYWADAMLLGETGLRLGITVYLPDVTLGIVALATIARWVWLPQRRSPYWALYLLVAVFALNLAQGLVIYKSAAGPSARPMFYALVALVYTTTFELNPKQLRSLFLAYAWTALGLTLLVLYRGVVVAFDVRELLPPSGSFQPAGHSVWRVIPSGETLVMAQAAFSLWAFALLVPGLAALRLLSPLLLLAVVLLQHRSVWLATFAGLAALSMGHARSLFDGKRLLPALAMVAVLGAGLALVGEGGGSGSQAHTPGGGVGADVAQSARDAVELKGTAGERLGSWRQLVRNWASGGPRQWAAGQPFGTSIERYASDDLSARRITYQPHNWYVELLVTQGLLGLVAYLVLLAISLRGMWRLREHAEYGLAARWLLVMLVFQHSYYLTYGVEYLQAFLMGAALVLATHARGLSTVQRAQWADTRPAERAVARWGRPMVRRWGQR
jgi:O-Antigen ligase